MRADFELYSGIVREGGLITLHDINPDRRAEQGAGPISGEVAPFWREISGSYRSEELIAKPDQPGFGIGLLFV